MKYLLDTDTLSPLIKAPVPSQLLAKLASVPSGEQCTSSITIGEIAYGAKRIGARGQVYWDRLRELVLSNMPVLSFDVPAALRYGEVRTGLEARGAHIGDADTRIASLALSRGLIVVTRNTRHFSLVPGLKVENWLDI